MNRLSIVFVFMLVACKSGDKPGAAPTDKPSGSAATPPPKFANLSVKVGTRNVEMHSARALRMPDGSTKLYASPNENTTCDELRSSMYDHKHVDAMVLSMPDRLTATGASEGVVETMYMDSSGEDAKGTANVSGAADAPTLTLELNFTSKNGKGDVVTVLGSVPAENCGMLDTSKGPGVPATPITSTAVMTVAGKEFPVRCAKMLGKDLELLDFPCDCDGVWMVGTWLVHSGNSWTLKGKRFAGESTGEAATLTIAAGAQVAATEPAGKPTVELTLSGEGKVGNYAVALRGNVNALVCR
ncbi:MAG TPA: hypothetical protein PLF40_03130 [Kofleriaceae bacterium]|nr:hypothetical protein [Kofleriaceae bacterium]